MLKVLQNQKGLSLLEIMFMIFLLSLVAIALASITIFSFSLMERSDHTMETAYVGKGIIDDFKSINIEDLYLYDGYDSSDETTLPVDEKAQANCLIWKNWVDTHAPTKRGHHQKD